MKKILGIFLFFFFAQAATGQAQINLDDSIGNVVFTVVEQPPVFPGGENNLKDYIKKNMQYPPAAYKEGRAGVCYLTFIVERDGSLSGIQILRGASGGADLNEEAIRLVKSMPKWSPGKQNGHLVKVAYNLAVRFLR
jgi:protein TonB